MTTLHTFAPCRVTWCDSCISGQISVVLLTCQILPVKKIIGTKLGVYSWRERGREGRRKGGREEREEGREEGGRRERKGGRRERGPYRQRAAALTVSARCLARVHKVRENASSSSSSSSLLSCSERGSHDVR